ncbi:MAG: GNAT family N-acetyltransferase [Gammaproteobacteria bacterium]
MQIRDATPRDFAEILALNEASVQFLSPLDSEHLAELHEEAAFHRVLGAEGHIDAFLLAFREGARYDSPNYQWFAARYPRYLYIDRVVVAPAQQGQGLGRRLYENLLDFAHASDARYVTCEFDVEPPNEASRRFHAAFGFQEVGTQCVGSARKRVSLQALVVAAENAV